MSRLILIIMCIVLMFSSCKAPVKLDKEKLDTAYFIGKYQADYLGVIEVINLKSNGTYDYVLKSKTQDTVIKNTGNWELVKSVKYSPSIYFESYPNIRSSKVFSEEGNRVSMTLNVKMGGSYMGDLETLVIDERGGELYYTFIKQDKSKNKNYIEKEK